jgi:hypothetical protein
MEFSIDKPAMRRAGTAGIEPAHAVLETAVLPLNYVPEDKKGKENRPSGVPESGSCLSPNRRYTGTCPVPRAYEMPRRKGMTAQLGCDHRFRSTVFASFCSRVVLMCLTIRTATSNSNAFIP